MRTLRGLALLGAVAAPELWLRMGAVNGFDPAQSTDLARSTMQIYKYYKGVLLKGDFAQAVTSIPVSSADYTIENLHDFVNIINAHDPKLFSGGPFSFVWFNPTTGEGFSSDGYGYSEKYGFMSGIFGAYREEYHPANWYTFAGGWAPPVDVPASDPRTDVPPPPGGNGNGGKVITSNGGGNLFNDPSANLSTKVAALEASINALGSGPIDLAGKVFPTLKPYLGVYPATDSGRIHAAQALEAAEYVLLRQEGTTPDLAAWKALLDDISATGTLPADYSTAGSPVLVAAIGTPIFTAINAYQTSGNVTATPGATTPAVTPGRAVTPAVAGIPDWILYVVIGFVALKVLKVL